MDLMTIVKAIVDLMGQYIQFVIPIVVTACIQLIKGQLERQGKVKKDTSLWFWVVFLSGIPMAIFHYGMQGWKDFNGFMLIILIFAYAATSSFMYQLWKVIIRMIAKKVTELNEKGQG